MQKIDYLLQHAKIQVFIEAVDFFNKHAKKRINLNKKI